MDDEYRINVSFPEEPPDLGLLVIVPKNSTIKDLIGLITKKVRKLFKRPFKCAYLTNAKGSVLDPEFTVLSALNKEDSIVAFKTKLKAALLQKGKRTFSEATADDAENATDSPVEDPLVPPPPPTIEAAVPAPPPAAIVEEKGKKSKRRKKDPNAPKRPMSSYLLFQESKRPEMMKNGLKGKDILREVGVLWKAMTDADKEPWIEKQKLLHTSYLAKMESYNSTKDLAVAGTESVASVDPPPPMPKAPAETSKKGKFDYKTFKKVGAKNKDVKAKAIVKAVLDGYNQVKGEDRDEAWLLEKLKSDKMIEWVNSTFTADRANALLNRR